MKKMMLCAALMVASFGFVNAQNAKPAEKKCNHTEQCAKDKKCDADKHECKDGKKDDKKCSKKECDKKPCCKKDVAKKGECNKKAKPVKK
ncbi:hypothetical protein [Segatella maculosa]|uniref:hypothetical protein n=1 Tax=Segatella maculosa TaxID=439703 RepID=UPI000361D05A|nr:hypothetical protein [Segatella maculosa]